MYATPVGVLGVWIRGLLSIALVAGAVTLLVNWYRELPPGPQPRGRDSVSVASPLQRIAAWRPGWDEETAMLAAGLFLVFLTFGGRLISPRLLLPKGSPLPEMGPGTAHRIVRPDGTVLHAESYGPADAPTLVLTHGWGLDRTEWAWFKPHWGERFRIVVWDLPGLGKSSEPNTNDYSLEKLAGDLRAVIEATSDKPVVLVGHSIGGMIVQTFFKESPELLGDRVLGAAIVHSTALNPLRRMLFSGLVSALQKPLVEPLLHLQIGMSPLLRLMNWMSYWNGSTHWSVKLTGFAGNETRSQLDYVAWQQTKASPAVAARGCLGMLRFDARDALPEVEIPILVVAGDLDPITLPEASEEIRQSVARGRLSRLSPAKHYGLIEHDQAFAKLVAEFCFETHSTRGQALPSRAAS